MITAIWCENSALVVGMPRRSTEWSTESSCTSVARWISSTTAASVTARGSSPPAAWWLRDRKSTRLNSSHGYISYAVFCLKKKKTYTAIKRAQFRHPCYSTARNDTSISYTYQTLNRAKSLEIHTRYLYIFREYFRLILL